MSVNVYQKVMICIVSNFGAGTFTRQELLSKMKKDYPEVAEGSILLADYSVNRHSKGDLSDEECFLYWIDEGKYRLFDPQRDSMYKFPKK